MFMWQHRDTLHMPVRHQTPASDDTPVRADRDGMVRNWVSRIGQRLGMADDFSLTGGYTYLVQ